MAIPFNLPSDEETEDTYRRIDQLLLDLYDLLRQLILRQRTHQRERSLSDARLAPTVEPQSARVAQLPREEPRPTARLPDIVADTLPPLPLVRKTTLCPARRRRPSRRHDKPTRRYARLQQTPYDDVRFTPMAAATTPAAQTPSTSWLNVGIELRQIAEEITFISRNGNSSTTKKRNEIKASSLFSLLVPAPVTGTFWTTVIILVGWRLLTKQR